MKYDEDGANTYIRGAGDAADAEWTPIGTSFDLLIAVVYIDDGQDVDDGDLAFIEDSSADASRVDKIVRDQLEEIDRIIVEFSR